MFLDGFGSPITYFKCTVTTTGSSTTYAYNLNDNTCNDGHHGWYGMYFAVYNNIYTTSNGGTGTTTDVWQPQFGPPPDTQGNSNMWNAPNYSYIRDPSGNYLRKDFMLLSWGGDHCWYAPNFLNTTSGYQSGWMAPPLSAVPDDANNLQAR